MLPTCGLSVFGKESIGEMFFRCNFKVKSLEIRRKEMGSKKLACDIIHQISDIALSELTCSALMHTSLKSVIFNYSFCVIYVLQPDYSLVPLNSDADVNNWLKFREAESPLVCLSVLISHDPVS